MSAGVAAAVLAVPGIAPVFALGLGAAALLGRGNGFGRRRKHCQRFRRPVVDIWGWFLRTSGLFPGPKRRSLADRCSNRVVPDRCHQLRNLDRLGLGTKKSAAPASLVSTREMDGPVIADFVGKIALAEGTMLLRDTIHDFLRQGNNRIILNLAYVDFIDSAGLGELVRTLASVRSHCGQLKLVKTSTNCCGLQNCIMSLTSRTTKPAH